MIDANVARATPLNPVALAAAKDALAMALRNIGAATAERVVDTLVRLTVRQYVVTERANKPLTHPRLHKETIALSQMQVDEMRIMPPECRQVWVARMVTARKLMDAPDAKWTISVLPGRTVVMRRPNGSPYEVDPAANKRALWLIQLPLDGRYQTPPEGLYKDRHSVTGSTKVAARKLLGVPNAQWSVKAMPDGLRIRRTV